jgi:hypothetical protein
METPEDLRRVTIPGRAGRRVATALLRPLTGAGFLTLGEPDEEGRHRVEVTVDGRRALEVWDRKQPTPAVISRKQEGRAQLRPLLGGEEARRRAAELEADLARRAEERAAWYAAWEERRAAEEFQERCDDAWAAVQGIRYRLGRHVPAGWAPTDEEVRLHALDADVVAHFRAEAARLAAEGAAVEPEKLPVVPAALEAVVEAPEASAAPAAGHAPELPAVYARRAAPHHKRIDFTKSLCQHRGVREGAGPNRKGRKCSRSRCTPPKRATSASPAVSTSAARSGSSPSRTSSRA